MRGTILLAARLFTLWTYKSSLINHSLEIRVGNGISVKYSAAEYDIKNILCCGKKELKFLKINKSIYIKWNFFQKQYCFAMTSANQKKI